ncbi:hypothetical protein EDB81DRAFT_867640 [Dactylonectria macrodidyma]|uniref:NmrA-like domain-containing protein n=1 Tax=Dactylonectria macrodidyma TaxID=307937 RepID=A0A9P9FB61_9HYPO|nr:hypothetical protein EDB81DRAFT_867640 [Dactylonectria macrodidyma]
MVKIAIAGGSGNVGQEILHALVARNKHEIRLLSRKDAPNGELPSGVTWVKTTYEDVAELANILDGVETVLSFMDNSAAATQRNLIDAAVQAGVRRFAPSEWATFGFAYMPWYSYKQEAREYLAEINKEKKVLEYTFFQPGLFTNYMTYPFRSSKHVDLFETLVNFHQRRALVREGGEGDIITLTTAKDTGKVVALAIEYEGEWPIFGGIRGAQVTISELIALGEKIRGEPFAVEKLKTEDLKAGVIKSSWVPSVTHQSIPLESREAFAGMAVSGLLLGYSAGNFDVSDAWNKLLPDYKFTQPEEFLTEAWAAIDRGEEVPL